jgi:Domain of unknown function (DUF4349)/Putative zinc-finger
MNITAHPVAPEEVMAFLDGELSAAEARTVSTHIEHCTDCAKIVEQFQRTSHSLGEWKVDPVPMKLEKSVRDSIARVESGAKIGKASLFIRGSFWTWKQWAVASGGALAVVVLVLAISVPNLYRSRKAALVSESAYYDTKRADKDTSGAGSAGKLQASQPMSEQQSNEVTTLVAPVAQGVAPDSKDLFHGTRNRARNSSSDDGEPITDKVGSDATPMISRTVSLSIVAKDFAASRSLLDRVLARHRGYFGQLNVSTPENSARSLQASLRIPAPELASALADLKTLGRVENESQSGEEVTQQHADLIARLKTSRETEQRFRDILQQRTGKLSEVLQVEEGIARVRGDIERMEAEQKELEHRVNFATVELQLTEEYRAQLNPPAASVSTRIYNGLVAGYHNASETVLGIVIFFAENGPTLLIWLAILGLPVILIWRRYRKALASI